MSAQLCQARLAARRPTQTASHAGRSTVSMKTAWSGYFTLTLPELLVWPSMVTVRG